MKVVSERRGYNTTTITATLYTHVVPELAREAAEKVTAIVPGGRPSGKPRGT